MPLYKVTIPYTGTQTCLVDADSPEEALQKAKKEEEFFREEIRLDWNNTSIKVSSQKKKNENNNMIKKWAKDRSETPTKDMASGPMAKLNSRLPCSETR